MPDRCVPVSRQSRWRDSQHRGRVPIHHRRPAVSVFNDHDASSGDGYPVSQRWQSSVRHAATRKPRRGDRGDDDGPGRNDVSAESHILLHGGHADNRLGGQSFLLRFRCRHSLRTKGVCVARQWQCGNQRGQLQALQQSGHCPGGFVVGRVDRIPCGRIRAYAA